MPEYQLRLLDFVGAHVVTMLPIAFKGALYGCRQYAKAQGYVWKPVPLSQAGGYFAHPETGNVLYLVV